MGKTRNNQNPVMREQRMPCSFNNGLYQVIIQYESESDIWDSKIESSLNKTYTCSANNHMCKSNTNNY
jgi:hypothetical protein